MNVFFKLKKVTAVMLLAAVFFWAFPYEAFAALETEKRTFPGDQWPGQNYQVGKASDLYTEKKIEAQTYPLNFVLLGLLPVGSFAGGPLARASGTIFSGIAAGYASTDKETALSWLNYPPSAFSFDSAEKSSYLAISGAVTNMATTFFNWIANLVFCVNKAFVLVANNIVVLCFDSQWVSNSADWIAQGISQISKGFSGGNGWLYIFFVFALCGLAISIVFNLLKSRVTNALSAFLIAVFCVAGIYFYMLEADGLISTISTATDNIAGIALSASSIVSDEPVPNITGDNITPLRRGITKVTNVAWFSNITCPWSVGQFGTADPNNLQITEDEWSGDGENISSAIEEGYEKEPIPSGKGCRLSYGLLENMVKNKTLYADTLYLGSDEETRAQVLKALSDETLDHGEHDETLFTCSAGSNTGWKHIIVAFLSFLPAAAYLIMCCFIAVPVIIAQLFLLILLVFLPIALLAGISGDAGVQVLIKYIKLILNCFCVKIFNGFFLGTVLFFSSSFVQAML